MMEVLCPQENGLTHVCAVPGMSASAALHCHLHCVLGVELYAAWGRGVNAFEFLKMESSQSGPCGKKPKYPGQVFVALLLSFI